MGEWLGRPEDAVFGSPVKGCINNVGRCHFCWCLKRDPKQTEPSVVCTSSKNYHKRSAKPHNTNPLSMIGWCTIYFGFHKSVTLFPG